VFLAGEPDRRRIGRVIPVDADALFVSQGRRAFRLEGPAHLGASQIFPEFRETHVTRNPTGHGERFVAVRNDLVRALHELDMR
jgi:hypothetical protein